METFQERVVALVIELDAEKESRLSLIESIESQAASQVAVHRDEIKKIDTRKETLQLIAAGEDPILIDLLLRSLTVGPPASPPPPPLPPAPEIKKIRVTEDGIWTVTQQFDSVFTLNQVVDVVCIEQGGVNDPDEKRRVRSSVNSMMTKLISLGKLHHHEKGNRSRQGLFRKVLVGEGRRVVLDSVASVNGANGTANGAVPVQGTDWTTDVHLDSVDIAAEVPDEPQMIHAAQPFFESPAPIVIPTPAVIEETRLREMSESLHSIGKRPRNIAEKNNGKARAARR